MLIRPFSGEYLTRNLKSPANNSLKVFSREGVFKLVVSELIRKEISEAPQEVQDFFSEMLLEADVAEITSKSLKLRDAYISAGILSPRWSDGCSRVT